MANAQKNFMSALHDGVRLSCLRTITHPGATDGDLMSLAGIVRNPATQVQEAVAQIVEVDYRQKICGI